MTPIQYQEIRRKVADNWLSDIEWSEGVKPPANADEFALEAGYVIINSGMKWKVAQGIWARVAPALLVNGVISEEFRHPGKREAINTIWRDRLKLFEEFMALETDQERLAFCANLPWVGDITKYHLAKNFGVNCAKPDRHLVRVAEQFETDTHTLCERLSSETGDRIATVDYVIWRACEAGIL